MNNSTLPAVPPGEAIERLCRGELLNIPAELATALEPLHLRDERLNGGTQRGNGLGEHLEILIRRTIPGGSAPTTSDGDGVLGISNGQLPCSSAIEVRVLDTPGAAAEIVEAGADTSPDSSERVGEGAAAPHGALNIRQDESVDPAVDPVLEQNGICGGDVEEWSKLSGQLKQDLACEGANHGGGVEGHDGGPAIYAVIVECTECHWGRPALFCAGRVDAITSSFCTMTCPSCDHVDTWDKFWHFIEEL